MKATAWLLLLVGLMGLLGWQGHSGSVEAAGSGPDLAISIDVNGGGDDCDTNAGTPGIGTTCNVAVGGGFTVKGHVLGYVGISGTGGYGGIHMRFVHSAGLTLVQRSGTSEMMWPDCGGASESKPASAYDVDCHDFVLPTSTFKGKVLEVDYTCATSGSRTVTMQDASTFLYDSGHAAASDAEGDEVLTINCAAGVGGVAELSDFGSVSPLAVQEGESFLDEGLMAGLAALGATSVLAAGLWYARRRAR